MKTAPNRTSVDARSASQSVGMIPDRLGAGLVCRSLCTQAVAIQAEAFGEYGVDDVGARSEIAPQGWNGNLRRRRQIPQTSAHALGAHQTLRHLAWQFAALGLAVCITGT